MAWMNVRAACHVLYGEPGKEYTPTHSHINIVNRMAKEGRFPRQMKVGRKWLVDLEGDKDGKKQSGASLRQ